MPRSATSRRQRSIALARLVLGNDATEQQIAEFVERVAAVAATLPPPTADQRAALTVLLRPERV